MWFVLKNRRVNLVYVRNFIVKNSYIGEISISSFGLTPIGFKFTPYIFEIFCRYFPETK